MRLQEAGPCWCLSSDASPWAPRSDEPEPGGEQPEVRAQPLAPPMRRALPLPLPRTTPTAAGTAARAALSPGWGCRAACHRYGNPNDPDRPKPDPPSLRKVLTLAKEDKPLLSLGLLFLCFSSMCTLSLPTLAGRVVDVVHVGADPSALRQACVQLAIIAIAGGLCSGARGFIFSLCGERLSARLRKRLFASIIAQETGFFDTCRTGELINRLSSDTQVIQSALTVNISMLVRGGIQATMALAMIFYTSWKLSLIMVGIIPLIIFIATRFGKFVKRVQGEVQDALADATTASEECMSSIRTVPTPLNLSPVTASHSFDKEAGLRRLRCGRSPERTWRSNDTLRRSQSRTHSAH